jgi:hypothetical protein
MKQANTFSTEQEYKEAVNKLNTYETARLAWCKANNTINKDGSSYMPTEEALKLPFGTEATNELRSKIEVWEFIHNVPSKYFLYIREKENEAVTWMGDFLGTAYLGNEYRDNFGGKRQSVTINAINGKTYYGTYYKSSGNYARIKQAK